MPQLEGELLLEVTLESDGDHVLFVRDACTVGSADRACADDGGPGDPESVALPVIAGQTLFIFVEAWNTSFSAGLFTLRASVTRQLPLGDACDPADATSVCVAPGRCIDDGTGFHCSDASPGLSCGTPAQLVPGEPFAGDFSSARDLTEASCTFSATPDMFVQYQATADVDLIVDGAALNGHVLSVRDLCEDGNTELLCDRPAGDLVIPNVRSGDELTFVVSQDRFAADPGFALRVTERAIIALGGSCTPDAQAARCADGLLCRLSGDTGVCAAPIPPTLESLAAAVVDLDLDGTDDGLVLRISATDGDRDLRGIRLTFRDANGTAVPLSVLDPQGAAVELASPLDVVMDGLAGVEQVSNGTFLAYFGAIQNRAELTSVSGAVFDQFGMRSSTRQATLGTLPVVNEGGACDPTLAANVCRYGNYCDEGTQLCVNPESTVCDAAVALLSDVTHTITTPGTDVTTTACEQRPGADYFFTYVVQNPLAEITVDALDPSGPEVAQVRGDCADASTALACVDYWDSVVVQGAPTLGIVVSTEGTPGNPVNISVTVRERRLLVEGEPCDIPSEEGRCNDGLICRADAEGVDRCFIPTAPTLSEATVRVVDRNQDTAPEAARVTAVGSDPDADIDRLRVELLSANGTVLHPLTHYVFGSEPVDFALAVELGVPSYANVSGATSARVTVVDSRGLASAPLVVPLVALTNRHLDQPCDPSGQTDVCALGLTCAADNDGNHTCRDLLAETCAAPVHVLQSGVLFTGDTTGQPDLTNPSCSGDNTADVLHLYPVQAGGMDLRVELTSPTDHGFSVRAACTDFVSQLLCRDVRYDGETEIGWVVGRAAGETLNIFVHPFTAAEASTYELRVTEVPALVAGDACTRGGGEVQPCPPSSYCSSETGTCIATACGNDVVEPGEQCDDGDTEPGDGCDADCQREPPRCGDGFLDRYVAVPEQCDDGNTEDDDGCSATCQFEPAVCPDGFLSPGEQCDDGNADPGDGCNACVLETIDETEPNDDGTPSNGNDFLAEAADGPYTADVNIRAAVDAAGDDDAFRLDNPGATEVTVAVETRGPNAVVNCSGTGIDTIVQVLDAAGELLFSVDDTSGHGLCTALTATIPPNGTIYLRVYQYLDARTAPEYFVLVDFQ